MVQPIFAVFPYFFFENFQLIPSKKPLSEKKSQSCLIVPSRRWRTFIEDPVTQPTLDEDIDPELEKRFSRQRYLLIAFMSMCEYTKAIGLICVNKKPIFQLWANERILLIPASSCQIEHKFSSINFQASEHRMSLKAETITKNLRRPILSRLTPTNRTKAHKVFLTIDRFLYFSCYNCKVLFIMK